MRGRVFNFRPVARFRGIEKEESQALNEVGFAIDLLLQFRFGRDDGAEGVGKGTSANDTKH